MNLSLEVVQQFIYMERANLDASRSNYFAFVFGEVVKYSDYLSRLYQEFLPVNDEYLDKARGKFSARPTVSGVTVSWESLYEQQAKLHLKIESIYLFANIFLDRVADATEFYFGEASTPWGSFDAMRQYFVAYSKNRELTIPSSNLIVLTEWLHANVCVPRHIVIAHKHASDLHIRYDIGTSYPNTGGEASFNIGIFYPNEGEEVIFGKPPCEILANIANFTLDWVAYLQANADKRNLAIPHTIPKD